MLKVLLIEDEPSYVDAVEVALTREGFELDAAEDGRLGLERFRDPSGHRAARPDAPRSRRHRRVEANQGRVRSSRHRAVRQGPEADVVSALELGADDYLTKPYSLRGSSRIRAAMRRNTAPESEEVVLAVGEAVLDPTRYELRIETETFALPV